MICVNMYNVNIITPYFSIYYQAKNIFMISLIILTQKLYSILRLHGYNSVVTRNHLRFTKLYEMKNVTLMIVDATWQITLHQITCLGLTISSYYSQKEIEEWSHKLRFLRKLLWSSSKLGNDTFAIMIDLLH